MSKEKIQRKNRLGWYGAIVSTIALALVVLNTYHLYYPPLPRAKLTIFIESYRMYPITNNELNFEVFGEIVNDGSIMGAILKWELFVNINMTHEIKVHTNILPDRSLSPSDSVSFTLGKSLIGTNDTTLPETAIKGCVVTIWYEDNIGLQTTEKEYGFT